MDSISPIPEHIPFPPIGDLVNGRPHRFCGQPIGWRSPGVVEPVYLGCFGLPNAISSTGAFLFGTRHELSDAAGYDDSEAPGFFVEFIVSYRDQTDGWQVARLVPHLSITYAATEDCRDFVPICDLGKGGLPKVADLSARTLPRWESADEAYWPLANGRPMLFLGQLTLPDTTLTRTKLTYAMTIYLFGRWADAQWTFKVIEQPSDEQSAEDHYALEE